MLINDAHGSPSHSLLFSQHHQEHEEGSENENHYLLGALEELLDHPQFVSRCLEAALPPNLGHCLRLMRVIELEAAAPTNDEQDVGQGKEGGADAGGEIDRPKAVTVDTTARIARVLVKVSKD